jgi:hypothetical protein
MSGRRPAVRARVYLRDSDAFGGAPAHAAIRAAFEEAGVRDVSVHHGIMGFDRSSGVMSSRPLRFHPDLPVVVEAVGSREVVEASLPGSGRCWIAASSRSRSLATLEGTREAATGELEALKGRREEAEELERDRDALLVGYAGLVPRGLDAFEPEDRRWTYGRIRLKVFGHSDGTIVATWAFG